MSACLSSINEMNVSSLILSLDIRNLLPSPSSTKPSSEAFFLAIFFLFFFLTLKSCSSASKSISRNGSRGPLYALLMESAAASHPALEKMKKIAGSKSFSFSLSSITGSEGTDFLISRFNKRSLSLRSSRFDFRVLDERRLLPLPPLKSQSSKSSTIRFCFSRCLSKARFTRCILLCAICSRAGFVRKPRGSFSSIRSSKSVKTSSFSLFFEDFESESSLRDIPSPRYPRRPSSEPGPASGFRNNG
mmetsp:Transcript_39629/g.95768  ORF Transcript_39629/g.95768 Transcript_39629/m.95768 type:complete len:246 (+) Transcript_39629:2356-3093(+)